MASSIKLNVIKTKDAWYISDNIDRKGYWGKGNIPAYKFDGEVPETTYKEDWYKIHTNPVKIEKRVAGGKVNFRWVIKEGFPVSAMTPAVLPEDPHNEESEYYEIKGLYSLQYDTLPDTDEEVEVEWIVIGEYPEFTLEKYNYPVTHNLVDEITTHPILLTEKECSLGGKALYELIRARIKRDINGAYARVTSDYDFSFEVKKSIKYNTPIAYISEEGKGRSKRSVTKYTTDKQVSVVKWGDGSRGYPPYPETITGKNYKDLESKVNEWMNEIMTMINEPLVECPHCDGSGVVLKH